MPTDNDLKRLELLRSVLQNDAESASKVLAVLLARKVPISPPVETDGPVCEQSILLMQDLITSVRMRNDHA